MSSILGAEEGAEPRINSKVDLMGRPPRDKVGGGGGGDLPIDVDNKHDDGGGEEAQQHAKWRKKVSKKGTKKQKSNRYVPARGDPAVDPGDHAISDSERQGLKQMEAQKQRITTEQKKNTRR